MNSKTEARTRAAAIAALQSGAPLDAVAVDIFEAENTSESEVLYQRGRRAASVSMLAKVLDDLGYEDAEATRAKWIIERERAVAALRDVCRDFGDNNWSSDLCLADVVEKHLARHLHETVP